MRRLDFVSFSMFMLISLIVTEFVYNRDLYFILNDEVIFDIVLLVLVFYVHYLLSTNNYSFLLNQQLYKVKRNIFMLYNLITSRYFIYRKKIFNDSNLIVIFNFLQKTQHAILQHYLNVTLDNVIYNIKSFINFRLKFIIDTKSVNLRNLLKISYLSKFFIFI